MFVSSAAELEERSLTVYHAIERVWRGRGSAAAVIVLLLAGGGGVAAAQGTASMSTGTSRPPNAALPEAPSAVLERASETDGQTSGGQDVGSDSGGDAAGAADPQAGPDPCRPEPGDPVPLQGPPPCEKNPIQPIVTLRAERLDSTQKGLLAIRNVIDPFNLLTVAAYSGAVIGADSHTQYGPGIKGFARFAGYGLAQSAQGEFLETYAIPSLVHEDPRYHRMPAASFKRRMVHALAHTVVSQHDDGSAMPNYATLLTYPLSAELSNLYVPGLQRDVKSTARRVAIGYAADPAASIVAEFLPDVARHIHIHIVFVQQILNAAMQAPGTTQ